MLTVDSLTRKYAGFTAVDNVSFTAQPGRVTGFLGPNGAGKSTTMRVMVGLTAPTSGSATIDGVRFADLPSPGLEFGVLLDASAQHAGRTGREILIAAADAMGLPRNCVDDGSVRTDADPALVGVVALDAGIVLTELRSAEGAGLEDMFLSLTADTQREGVAA